MTDNRTTELLRKLLTERGVKYSDFTSATKNGKAIFKTRWKHECGYAELSEWEPTGSNNLFIQNVDPEQAIAATLGSGTLTAEQVEKAIRDCSTYASYDGCTYYASGIRLQAIADELNARAERTCENTNTDGYGFRFGCSECGYSTIVHNCTVRLDELPRFCPNCGAKVRDE